MPTSATIEITTRNRYHPSVQSHDHWKNKLRRWSPGVNPDKVSLYARSCVGLPQRAAHFCFAWKRVYDTPYTPSCESILLTSTPASYKLRASSSPAFLCLRGESAP